MYYLYNLYYVYIYNVNIIIMGGAVVASMISLLKGTGVNPGKWKLFVFRPIFFSKYNYFGRVKIIK